MMAAIASFLRRIRRTMRRLSDCGGRSWAPLASMVVVAACVMSSPRGPDADAGVDDGVGDIDEDVRDDEEGGAEEDEGQEDIEVGGKDGRQRFPGDPRNAEELFDKERAGGNAGERKANQGDHGEDGGGGDGGADA